MHKFLPVFILAISTASANAATWPWQDTTEVPIDYCKGFVIGGLNSTTAEGPYRTDLWLAWNYLVRSAPGHKSAGTDDYQAGHEQFKQTQDAVQAQSLVDEAKGSCGLGRKGLQVTGW